MTLCQLYEAIREHADMPDEWLRQLPPNSEAFGKYVRDSGIKRYNSKGERFRRTSRFRRRDEA